jgi:membrane-bound lytic murein transglycosylase B
MVFNKKFFLFFAASVMLVTHCFAMDVQNNPAVQKFIKKIASSEQIPKDYLQAVFTKIKLIPEVVNKIQKPYESQSWEIYRTHFVNGQRITDGVRYWQRHQMGLNLAEKKYGVPASIIVAIVGVESNYGLKKMDYVVINSLATLAFYYPPRADFFRNELAQFLLLTRALHVNPFTIRGSYAGAIGFPQFMPSSYRRYAVCYSKHSYPDLFHDNNDVIFSVANFLNEQGWQRGEPIAVPAETFGNLYQSLRSLNQQKNYTLEQLAGFNVTPKVPLTKNYSANFLELPGYNTDEYWLVMHNFKVIMRYNSSEKYALAVTELAKKIKEKYRVDLRP